MNRPGMSIFYLTLLLNSVTLAVTVLTAARKRILFFKLLAIIALCATGAALYQVFTEKGNIFAWSLTTLMVFMMSLRLSSLRRSRGADNDPGSFSDLQLVPCRSHPVTPALYRPVHRHHQACDHQRANPESFDVQQIIGA
jgi:hypothetical protein